MPDAVVQIQESIATVTIDSDQVVETVTINAESAVQTVPVGVVGPQGPGSMPRSITIANPRVGDNFVIFYSERPTILKQARAILSGSGAEVEFQVYYASSRSVTGTPATIISTVHSTTLGESIEIQNMPIPDNNYVWVLLTQVNGVVTEFNLSLET